MFFSVEDLRLSFGGIEALKGVSFSVAEAEIFSLIGPNGAGKTTVFNCLSRFCRQDTGTIRFNGKDVSRLRRHEVVGVGIARTFQNLELFSGLSTLDNIMVGCHTRTDTGFWESLCFTPGSRRREYEARERAEQIIEFLELEAVRKTDVKMGFYYSLYEWFHPWWSKERERFVKEHFHPQFKDLAERYRPDILWGDGEWDMPAEKWETPELLAWLFNESLVKDTVVINDRWGKGIRQKHGGAPAPCHGRELPPVLFCLRRPSCPGHSAPGTPELRCHEGCQAGNGPGDGSSDGDPESCRVHGPEGPGCCCPGIQGRSRGSFGSGIFFRRPGL